MKQVLTLRASRRRIGFDMYLRERLVLAMPRLDGRIIFDRNEDAFRHIHDPQELRRRVQVVHARDGRSIVLSSDHHPRHPFLVPRLYFQGCHKILYFLREENQLGQSDVNVVLRERSGNVVRVDRSAVNLRACFLVIARILNRFI